MKLSKLLLTSTTALGLSMTAAVADGNDAFTEQVGSDNDMLIEQTGSDNEAGNAGEEWGREKTILQNGDNNDIDILQSASGGRIGYGRQVQDPTSDTWGNNNQNTKGVGVQQQGDKNVLSVEQTGNNMKLSAVYQESYDESASGNAQLIVTPNKLTVEQSGGLKNITYGVAQIYLGDGSQAGNEITINQNATGSNNKNEVGKNNSPAVLQEGWGNTVTNIQHDGKSHVIGYTSQVGNENTSTVEQGGGNDNTVNRVKQEGDRNTSSLTFSGGKNGGSLTSAAGSVGAPNSGVRQIGVDNAVDMSVTASYTEFGFRQVGSNNSAEGISITGDSNKLGVNQNGNNNTLDLATITGEGNDIGLEQQGSDNIATLAIDGDNNGGGNTFTGGGDAASVLTTSMGSGLVLQYGDNNGVNFEITSGDNNAFAFQQGESVGTPGSGNSITGTIDGSNNQVAVAQLGSNNSANFSQVGSSNNLGIGQ